MKTINVYMVKEHWLELYEILKLLTNNVTLNRSRLKKYIGKWSLTFLEYNLITSIYSDIFSNYTVNFIKFTDFIYFKIDIVEFYWLISKFETIFEKSIFTEKLDFSSIIIKFISNIHNHNNNKDLIKFIILIYFIGLWIKFNLDHLWNWNIKYRYKTDIKKKWVNNLLINVNNKLSLLWVLRSIVSDNSITELIIIWNIWITNNWIKWIKSFCDMNRIKFCKYNLLELFDTKFNNKLFIINEYNYRNNYKNYFSFNWNYIVVI